jgi:hypothetical protein
LAILFLPFKNRTIQQPDKNDHSKTGLVLISDVDWNDLVKVGYLVLLSADVSNCFNNDGSLDLFTDLFG